MTKTIVMVVAALITASTASAQQSSPETVDQFTVGSFTVTTTKDEISGKIDTSIASTHKAIAVNPGPTSNILMWLCHKPHGASEDEVMLMFGWNKPLGGNRDMIKVQYRFASEPEGVTQQWLNLGNKAATPSQESAATFTSLAAKNESVVLRVVDLDGESLTFTFPLLEFNKALSHLPCSFWHMPTVPTVNPDAANTPKEVAGTEAAALEAVQKGAAK